MKLSELHDEWEKDSIIDHTDIATASILVPKLHGKYLRLLGNTKLQLRKAETEFIQLRAAKATYYKGETPPEELRSRGWKPFLKKILKGDVFEYVASDEDILVLGTKVEYLKTCIMSLESILKELGSRSFHIKNHVTYLQWSQGAG